MARKMKTMDGNTAAATVAYSFTDVAAIYPITPSSVMAEITDKMAVAGKTNLFGQTVKISEMQSEGGVAGAVHGSLAAGELTTTFTASQGLLLMIPNLYKIAGELLPAVIHVSARTLATHALSIFGDHSDIYACRQTGFAMLCSNSPQEAMDLSAAAHLSAIRGSVPFIHFFDGFRTSHEIQKIEVWDENDLADLLDFDAVYKFRRNALNPEHPVQRGTAQNPDVFFQARESANKYYDDIVDITVDYLNKINDKIGTDYKPFNYYGAPDADRVIIAMGSVCQTAEETIDYLNAHGEKVGIVKVHLYRPFSAKHLIDVIPETVKKIAVLDRTKEPGSIGEPLYLDVIAALFDSKFKDVLVTSGRYGLSSKDTTPGQIIAVYDNLNSNNPKKRFTIGIEDDVTHLSLPYSNDVDTTPKGTTSCKFWGLGADGTVGANKNSIKIIGDNTDMFAQGYFSYDSKKSGGVTISHLRFGKSPIKSSYLINRADFAACHNPSYMKKYDIVSDIKPGGTFLLNCPWTPDELDENLCGDVKSYIANNNISFYIINAREIDKKLGLQGRINTVLQAAFFKITNIIPVDDTVRLMKKAVKTTYALKGSQVVQMNFDAIDSGIENVVKVNVPDSWKNESGKITLPHFKGNSPLIGFVNNVLVPISAQKGDELPVSAFAERANGEVPSGSSAFEKRGIAEDVPLWIPENCIQCNFCSFVCPHAVIRPAVMNENEAENAPNDMDMKPMNGLSNLKFAVTVSVLDCTGCGSCVDVCPGTKGKKALAMKPLVQQLNRQIMFDYGRKLSDKPEVAEKFKADSVKGSQFRQPLFEFSGACAGCGETPYAKLAAQLFGDKMYIANATGCSSIWGASFPYTPYTVNKKGKGPAWQNSLFEDNAEFGYGMLLAQDSARERLRSHTKALLENDVDEALKSAAHDWIDTYDDCIANESAAEKFINQLEKIADNSHANAILNESDRLAKKTVWVFGGDGWAYDIGFGGLDHVIAQNRDINILIFDTEVYSNTGGQASKATPTGAIAQFAASGKITKKKDLAAIAMTYGYVYVAQVSMGADMNQCVKAFSEAQSYNGPSVIIAYSPCISHGIKGGMTFSQSEEKKAVAAGYWNLFRYDPRKIQVGENPFTLDSKKPTEEYSDFLLNELRYSALKQAFPEKAEELFAKAEKDAKAKFDSLSQRSGSV